MRFQSFVQAVVATSLSVALMACGGGGIGPQSGTTTGTISGTTSGSTSGGSSTGTTGGITISGTPAHINLQLGSPTENAEGTAEVYPLDATVTDANNVAVTNSTVAFTSTVGAISVSSQSGSPNSTLTNSTGDALASISIPNNATAGNYTVTATDKDVGELSSTVSISVTSPSSLALGTISGSTFTEGAIAVSNTPIAAGASTTLTVNLVETANSDALYPDSATVTFTSSCITNGTSKVTSPVTSSNGTFTTTYTAAGCTGDDVVTASTTVSGATTTATGTVTVNSAEFGSIVFTSPTQPTTIGLKGLGSVDTVAVVFTVLDKSGAPLSGQTVNFALSSSIGGLSLSPASAVSGANGTVSTTVRSGTVKANVTVTADAPSIPNSSVGSNLIAVSTGVPTEFGMSIAASSLNILGDDVDGITSTVTARLVDRYQNPVVDGTVVSFTAEGGGILPSCPTVGGACSVTFTSQGGRTRGLSFPASGGNSASPAFTDNNCSSNNHNIGCDDHRYTILATATGEESFNDCHGSGLYNSSTSTDCPNGDFFVSLGEAFLDNNENGVPNLNSETYFDYNNDGSYTPASGKFIGLLCSDPNCDPNQTELDVRQSLVIVMASSVLTVFVSENYPTPQQTPTNNVAPTNTVSSIGPIQLGQTKTVFVTVGDSALQVPPVGSTISASLANGGTILAPSSSTVVNTDEFGYYVQAFTIVAPSTSTTDTDQLNITVTSPGSNGSTSTVSIPVQYSVPATEGPVLSQTPTRIAFPSQKVGTSSAPAAVTLSNTGNAPMNLSTIGASGDYSESDDCGSTLAAGASCTINVTFTPTTVTSNDSGTLTVTTTNAGNGTTSLQGTSTAN